MNLILKKTQNPDRGKVYRDGGRSRACTFPWSYKETTIDGQVITEGGVPVSPEFFRKNFLEIRALMGFGVVTLEDAFTGAPITVSSASRSLRPAQVTEGPPASPAGETPVAEEAPHPAGESAEETQPPEPSVEDLPALENLEPEEEIARPLPDDAAFLSPEPSAPVEPEPAEGVVETPVKTPDPAEPEEAEEELPEAGGKKKELSQPPKDLEKMNKRALVEWLFSNGFERADLEKMSKKELAAFGQEILGGGA